LAAAGHERLLGVSETNGVAKFQNADDTALDTVADDIIARAKFAAAFDAKFAAPTPEECQTLPAKMQELDAAAKLGMLSNAVTQ
jgi:hypothetical protein